jgi:hypothetical protein
MHWIPSIVAIFEDRGTRALLVTLYYLAILIGLLVLYGPGDFSTPNFIYQGF